jgi:hypothetical protein
LLRFRKGIPLEKQGIPDTELAIFEAVRQGGSYAFYNGLYILSGRQLFQTRDQRFGFARTGVQAGDKLCIFDGSPVVHALRAVPREQSEAQGQLLWQLIGEAYVHGMMNGEVSELGIESEDIMLV